MRCSRIAFRSSPVLRRTLGDDRGQEAVERLLGAAVGIVDQVRQGVDQRAGQASASSGLRAAYRTGGGPRGRDVSRAELLVGPDRAGEGSILSMPWTKAGKLICMASDSSSVSAFMRTIASPFVDDLDPPVDPLLAAGLDAHGSRRRVEQLEHAAVELEHDATGFSVLS